MEPPVASARLDEPTSRRAATGFGGATHVPLGPSAVPSIRPGQPIVSLILACLALVLVVVTCAEASEPAADRRFESLGEPATSRAKEDGALPDELVILGGGKEVPALVKELGGEITFSVEETNTHQAKFPVKNVAELEMIAEKLRAKGVQVMRVHVFRPPEPGGPQ